MARENIFEGSSSQLVSLCASCNLIYLSSLLETAVGAGLKMRKSTKVNFKSFFLSLSFKKRELIRHFEEVGASATTSHSVSSSSPFFHLGQSSKNNIGRRIFRLKSKHTGSEKGATYWSGCRKCCNVTLHSRLICFSKEVDKGGLENFHS